MASSFEPINTLTPRHDDTEFAQSRHPSAASAPIPGAPSARQPWFTLMPESRGFRSNAKFSPPSRQAPAEGEQEQIDTVSAEAIAEAERRGREEALAQIASEDANRDALKLSFQRLDENLYEQLSSRLSEAVIAICEATLAPMALDKDALQHRCIAVASKIGDGLLEASLRLHPDDVAMLDPDFASTWHIEADPDQERGTVVFDTPEGLVSDGPAEWRTALREALGLC